MKKYLLIIVAFILPDSLIGQERNDVKQKEVSALFQKTEKEMQNHYNYLDKKRIFEDPIGRADYFFKTVKRVAPSLLSDTKLYKDEILNLLIDTTYKKNYYSNWDIMYILYNLPLDDYVGMLYTVSALYKQNNIDFDLFTFFIFQDFNVSNAVAKNYQNEKLQVFLNKLLEDKEIVNKAELQDKDFRERILNLKNGVLWEGGEDGFGLKKLDKSQPPILNTTKTEH